MSNVMPLMDAATRALLQEAHDAIEAFRNHDEPYECVDYGAGIWVEKPDASARYGAALRRLDVLEHRLWLHLLGAPPRTVNHAIGAAGPEP